MILTTAPPPTEQYVVCSRYLVSCWHHLDSSPNGRLIPLLHKVTAPRRPPSHTPHPACEIVLSLTPFFQMKKLSLGKAIPCLKNRSQSLVLSLISQDIPSQGCLAAHCSRSSDQPLYPPESCVLPPVPPRAVKHV